MLSGKNYRAKITSIILGDHFDGLVGQRVAAGRYGSASEVVRAGLRLLEENEAQLEALQSALIAGENSGTAKPFNSETFLHDMRQKHAAKA